MPNVSNVQLKEQLESFQASIEASVKKLCDKTDDTAQKIDVLTARLDKIDDKLNELDRNTTHNENRITELSAQVENVDQAAGQQMRNLTARIIDLEDKIANLADIPKKVEPLEEIPTRVAQLIETVEDRTNRQLRETLVFKNIPEEENEKSYDDTKKLLATVISEHCPNITYATAFNEIKRAHRESKRRGQDRHRSREGKRLIYAAFHGWDICQAIIKSLKQKCIADNAFEISADQKYGPLTTKRRQLAFTMRRQLKDAGIVGSSYVDFPARLMVNYPGEMTLDGKKVYKIHKDFSKDPVDFSNDPVE